MARLVSTTSGTTKRKYANGVVESKYTSKRVKHTTTTSSSPGKKPLITLTTTSHSGTHPMHTRSVTCTITRDAVFNTPELLTHILVHLPPADLLTARQTNTHWRELIALSPVLNYTLCTAKRRTHHFWACDLATGVVGKHKIAAFVEAERKWRAGHNVFVPARINSLLFEESSVGGKKSFLHRAVYCEAFRFVRQPDLGVKESVVLEMFVCQPPTEAVVTEFFYGFKPAPGSRRKTIRYNGYLKRRVYNKGGVTYGDIVRDFVTTVTGGSMGDRSRNLAIDVEWTRMWVRRMVFPSDEEWDMVEKGLHAPTEDEVKDFKGLVAKVGGGK